MQRDARHLFRQRCKELDLATAQINAIVGRVRAAAEQKRQAWRFAGVGLAAGILLWSILPGTIARTMPESWHWPERMARKAVGEPTILEVGLRMIESQNPEGFEELMAAHRLFSANREAVEQCIDKAQKAESSIGCTIRIGP